MTRDQSTIWILDADLWRMAAQCRRRTDASDFRLQQTLAQRAEQIGYDITLLAELN